jgi:transposase
MEITNRTLAEFTGIPVYAGIDVHKKSWKVTIRTQHSEHKTFSMDPSPSHLAGYLHKHFPGGRFQCVYEAGHFGFWAYRDLTELGLECLVVNPADIPTMGKEKDKKTDANDSRKLARGLKDGTLEGIYVPELEQEADRDLVRRRKSLVCHQTILKNQIKAYLTRYNQEYPKGDTGHWTRAYMRWLESLDLGAKSANQTLQTLIRDLRGAAEKILEQNRLLRDLSREPRYAEQVRLLKTIPSIGPITAIVLLTELGDTSRFKTFDSLCCYVGLVPSTNSSGEQEKVGRMSNRGNAHVKGVLIECAWVARRLDPALTLSYENLVKNMKAQEAIIRIAKKLLSRIRYVLLNKQPYVIGVVK